MIIFKVVLVAIGILLAFQYGTYVQAQEDDQYLKAADVVIHKTLSTIVNGSEALKLEAQLRKAGCR